MKAKIVHIAVYTADIERLKAFYEKYFDGVSGAKYENSKGFSSYFVSFGDSVGLEIMSHTELKKIEVIDKVNGYSHISLSVGGRENVDKLTSKLEKDGFKVYIQPRVTGDGYYESCVSDTDGNPVEITE